MFDPSTRAFARPRFSRHPITLPLVAAAIAVPAAVVSVAVPSSALGLPLISGTPAHAATAVQLESAIADNAQSFSTGSADLDVSTTASVSRDRIKATTEKQLERKRAREAARAAAAAAASSYSYAGLTNPGLPGGYALSDIVAIAKQYYGTPYVFGGSSPAGFDCSGFTSYVFAQVGVSLPHGSIAQGGLTRIDASAAKPGDIVVIDGATHVGIYAGGGMMIDAPYAGKTVGLHDIYSSNHYFVRPGV